MAEPLDSDLAQRARFSMLKKTFSVELQLLSPKASY